MAAMLLLIPKACMICRAIRLERIAVIVVLPVMTVVVSYLLLRKRKRSEKLAAGPACYDCFAKDVRTAAAGVGITGSDVLMVEKIMQMAVGNLCRPELHVPYVLEGVYKGRSTLYNRLKCVANMTPGKIILHARLSRARQLLAKTNMNACDIGAAVGYPDPAYFSTFFHKSTGMTPMQFRDACERKTKDYAQLDYFSIVLADGRVVSVRLPDCPVSSE